MKLYKELLRDLFGLSRVGEKQLAPKETEEDGRWEQSLLATLTEVKT